MADSREGKQKTTAGSRSGLWTGTRSRTLASRSGACRAKARRLEALGTSETRSAAWDCWLIGSGGSVFRDNVEKDGWSQIMGHWTLSSPK